MERQEEREKELQAERKKRAEEGPPPTVRAPPAPDRTAQADASRRTPSSLTSQTRSARQSEQMAAALDTRSSEDRAASHQQPSGCLNLLSLP